MWHKIGKTIFTEIKKFGFIKLALICVLVALCIFVKLPSRQNVAEASQEGIVSEENSGNLGLGSRARQRIYFKKDVVLYSIDMRFDMQNKTANTDFLTVYIYDKATMEEVGKKRVYRKNMVDGEMTPVRFKGGLELTGKHSYLVVVTGPKLKEGEVSPAVRLASFSAPNKRLYIGGSLVKNQTLDTIYNYQYDDSTNTEAMYIAGILLIMLLVPPKWFWHKIGDIKGVGWALFISNPWIVFYITLMFYELQNGRAVEVIKYNCLLLFVLQLIVYGITGRKYMTLLINNTLCFLLSVVNLQVSIFKGVPLIPADFLFLKTAAEVSSNYEITWTHAQIAIMTFMAVYMFFIIRLTTFRKPKTEIAVGAKKPSKWENRKIKNHKLKAKCKKKFGMENQEQIADEEKIAASREQKKTETIEQVTDSEQIAEKEQVVLQEEKNEKEQNKVKGNVIGRFFQKYYKQMAKLVFRIALFSVGIYGIYYLYYTPVLQQNQITVDIWNRNKSYKRHGIYLEFFMNFHYLMMEKPEGYSPKAVEQILDKTATKSTKEEKTNPKTGSKDPNIIIVMNESLSDYTLLDHGDAMTYNKDYLPYIHSLNENVNKGKCYVSVFGGQTANSEFECLTGNSLAFMPASSVPYQQFIRGTTFSLPMYLETLGYKTTAIHPCVGTNWNRDTAYASMNFGQFLTQNDFQNPEYVRYISDNATYDKVIDQFDQKKADEKLFIMAVTMQNHGGYTDQTEWKDPITAGDGDYSLADEYLSSAHISDEAYKNLIQYFSNYDEPTVILMFGDHQPAIEPEFLNTVLGAPEDQLNLQQIQEKYCTPYVLWANYDIDTKTDGITSTNFLSNMLLENAGLPLSKYNQFISTVQTNVDAMNAFGYRTKDGIWHSYQEKTDATKELKEYNILEYGYFSDKNESTMSKLFAMPTLQDLKKK